MDTNTEKKVSPPVDVTDGRGALPHFWHVAYTRPRHEKAAVRYLSCMGYDTYLPLRTETHRWSDRKRVVQAVVFPMLLFVRMPKSAVWELERLSFISCFLRVSRRSEAATVPDSQLERFRFMIEHSADRVVLVPGDLSLGDRVRVTDGDLEGLEGNVYHCPDGSHKIVVVLDNLGCACVTVPIESLEVMK